MILWTLIPLFAIAIVLWWYHSVCLRRLQKTWLYGWFMRHIAHLRLSFWHANMTTEKYRQGLALLERGHILLTTDRCALSRFLVPGIHTHAMLCIGDGKVADAPTDADHLEMLHGPTCAEMTHEDYGEIDFAEACFHSSRVVILRCDDWDIDYVDGVIIPKCRSYKLAKYDNEFDPDAEDGDIFCSLLLWASDVERRLDVVMSRAWGTGQRVVTPTNLADASNVEVVWDSDVTPPVDWPGFPPMNDQEST